MVVGGLGHVGDRRAGQVLRGPSGIRGGRTDRRTADWREAANVCLQGEADINRWLEAVGKRDPDAATAYRRALDTTSAENAVDPKPTIPFPGPSGEWSLDARKASEYAIRPVKYLSKPRLPMGMVVLVAAREGDAYLGKSWPKSKSPDDPGPQVMGRVKWWRESVLKAQLEGYSQKHGMRGTWFFRLPNTDWPPSPAAMMDGVNEEDKARESVIHEPPIDF